MSLFDASYSPYAQMGNYGSFMPQIPNTGVERMSQINVPQLAPPVDFSSQMASWGSQPLSGSVAEPGFMDRLKATAFDSTSIDPKTGAKLTSQGWTMPALSAGMGLFNAWMGMKQYGLAKDSLNENKRQFGLNFDAQKQTTNSALEDRQRARVASNPGAYQSVGDYMAANGIRG